MSSSKVWLLLNQISHNTYWFNMLWRTLYQISWKSNKQFNHWHKVTDKNQTDVVFTQGDLLHKECLKCVIIHKDWAWIVANMQLLVNIYNQLSLNHWSGKRQTVNQPVKICPIEPAYSYMSCVTVSYEICGW